MKALLVLAGPISRDKYKVLDIKSIEEAREFMPGNTPDHILFSIAMSEGGGEEHGCILFMDVGEEAEEERRETNVLTNEWLYSHNNMTIYTGTYSYTACLIMGQVICVMLGTL